jgi:hypothetical protein
MVPRVQRGRVPRGENRVRMTPTGVTDLEVVGTKKES